MRCPLWAWRAWKVPSSVPKQTMFCQAAGLAVIGDAAVKSQ